LRLAGFADAALVSEFTDPQQSPAPPATSAPPAPGFGGRAGEGNRCPSRLGGPGGRIQEVTYLLQSLVNGGDGIGVLLPLIHQMLDALGDC
jgi:hypothetical protein